MIDQPETQGSTAPTPQGKLILPAYDDGHALGASGSLPQVHIRPEQLIRHTATPPPQAPLARLRYFWHKDPAYKVLIIAMGMVLVAGLVFASLLSNALLRNPNSFAVNNTFSQNAPGAPVPSGTVDLRPTFAPPGGGKGSNTSSQPPAQGTPATGDSNPTTQPSPNPTQDGGTLSVQITNIPARVRNNSTVNVDVNTSEANVTVTLYILYTAPPFRDSAGPRLTNDSGDASIPWSVLVYKSGEARAMVFALARDSSGQRAESQPVTVQIAGFGG